MQRLQDRLVYVACFKTVLVLPGEVKQTAHDIGCPIPGPSNQVHRLVQILLGRDKHLQNLGVCIYRRQRIVDFVGHARSQLADCCQLAGLH